MSAPREQEQSIKERKRLLFDDDPQIDTRSEGDRKPFALYLREVPAAPLSPLIKAALWGAGLLVALLLGAAAYKMSQPREKAASTKPRADASIGAIASRRLT